MSEYCSSTVTVVFHLKDNTEVKSKRIMEDMEIQPKMLIFLCESDVARILEPIKSGYEFLQAIDSLYDGCYLDKFDPDTKGADFNVEAISEIMFDDVTSISITEMQDDASGDSEKTFIYDPGTKECTFKENYHLDCMDGYCGDSENAEAILSMYSMMDTPPEEIAEILHISLEEVLSVIESVGDEESEEDWD